MQPACWLQVRLMSWVSVASCLLLPPADTLLLAMVPHTAPLRQTVPAEPQAALNLLPRLLTAAMLADP